MSTIEIHKNSITHLKTDAVVNAANSSLSIGGGVCGAIFKAAGIDELTEACSLIQHCNTGDAVVTPAFKMKNNRYIIHAVGPVYKDGMHQEDELLYSCYKQALIVAKVNGCKSIGFPLISSGVFKYPLEEAWRIALKACMDFQNTLPIYDIDIVFVSTNQESVDLGKAILSEMIAKATPDCRILTKYKDVLVCNAQDINTLLSLFISDMITFSKENPRLNLEYSKAILDQSGVRFEIESMCQYDVSKANIQITCALLFGALCINHAFEGALLDFINSGAIHNWLTHLSDLCYS